MITLTQTLNEDRIAEAIARGSLDIVKILHHLHVDYESSHKINGDNPKIEYASAIGSLAILQARCEAALRGEVTDVGSPRMNFMEVFNAQNPK